MDELGKQESIMGKIRELMMLREDYRPEEELIVMVLPKYNRRERKRILEEICERIRDKKWQQPDT